MSRSLISIWQWCSDPQLLPGVSLDDVSLRIVLTSWIEYAHWTHWYLVTSYDVIKPGARSTNGISIELEIRSKFWVLWFKMCSTDLLEILHTSRQCYYRIVCKMSQWSVEYVINKSIKEFYWISNSIEKSLRWGKHLVNIISGNLTKADLMSVIWKYIFHRLLTFKSLYE